MATVGWYYFHHYNPLYDDSIWRLPIVPVEDNELKELRQCTDKDPMEEVMALLFKYCEKAKKISDAIIGPLISVARPICIQIFSEPDRRVVNY